jgi:hypothetical protein
MAVVYQEKKYPVEGWTKAFIGPPLSMPWGPCPPEAKEIHVRKWLDSMFIYGYNTGVLYGVLTHEICRKAGNVLSSHVKPGPSF